MPLQPARLQAQRTAKPRLPEVTILPARVLVLPAPWRLPLNSKASAALPEGRHVTAHNGGGTANLSLLAQNLTESSALADGGATTSEGGTGVGAGDAVSVANVVNEAFIGAGAVVSADGVNGKATTADRDVKFETTTLPIVDTAKDTIFVGLDSGLKTGDKKSYDANGGTAIGGLTHGSDYFIRAEDCGENKLYDTNEHSKACSSDRLVVPASTAVRKGD